MSLVRVFLDANVLFNAVYSAEGRAAVLLTLAEFGRCELFTSPHALTEARRNLELKRPEGTRRLEDEVLPRVGLVPEAGPEAVRAGLERGLPQKDAPILGAAMQAGVDILVTDDARHFKHLFGKSADGVEVLTSRAALDRLL